MVTTSEWVIPLATAVLSGGMGAAVTAIAGARIASRKASLEERHAPAHLEAVFLGSAEKAVAALVVALDRAEAEIEDLKRDRDEERAASRQKDHRIDELEDLLATLRRELEQLRRGMSRAQTLAQEVRDESTENPPG